MINQAKGRAELFSIVTIEVDITKLLLGKESKHAAQKSREKDKSILENKLIKIVCHFSGFCDVCDISQFFKLPHGEVRKIKEVGKSDRLGLNPGPRIH